MNNQTQPIPVLLHDLILNVVKTEFGLVWRPRVVRQHKTLQVGTLSTIDYAIPCYELAHKLKVSASALAKDIEILIIKHGLPGFKAEAVEGYINIEASTPVLQDMVNQSLAWYDNPALLTTSSNMNGIMCYMVGINIANYDSMGTTEYSRAYLEQIFNVLGIQQDSEYLISDYSESVIDSLLERLLSGGASNSPETRKHIRKFLSDTQELKDDSLVSAAHRGLREDWLTANEQKKITEGTLTFESEITEEVHKFLDDYSFNELFPVLKDEASKATYYLGEHETFSLRSANGLIYMLAYILYGIYRQAEQRKEGSSLIVMGSHRLNLVISTYIKFLVEEASLGGGIIYFDPRVSKADIADLRLRVPDLKKFFIDVKDVLQSIQLDGLDDSSRKAILTLVDLPKDMSYFASQAALPPLFDCVSQAVDAHDLLKSVSTVAA